MSLLTGNYRRGAELKLAHHGLWSHFTGGAFGDVTHDRAALLGEANALTEPDGENDESWGFRARGRASAWRIGPEDVGDPVPGDPSPQAAVRRQRIVGVITLRVATEADFSSSR